MTTAAAAMRPTGKPTPSGRLRTVSDQTRMVYFFGRTRTDGDASQRALLGGKGANLAEMTSIGLPVPPGFTDRKSVV